MDSISTFAHNIDSRPSYSQYSTAQPLTSQTVATTYYVSDNATATAHHGQQSDSPSTHLSISDDARQKLADEQSQLGQKLAKQLNANRDETVSGQENESDIERLDKMIEDIKEQIEETQRELSALNSDKSEQAEEKRKQLELDLMVLNATLIGLMGKKMDALEQPSS